MSRLRVTSLVLSALAAMSVGQDAVKFDPTIVRGLEYYTGAVFEAELLLDTVDDKGRPVRFGSIGGGLLLLVYALYRRDPVFIAGQAFGVFVYLRNLYFVLRDRKTAAIAS